MENIIIQQESPMDLSINSIKQDRDCSGSTGSQSPRSDHSLDISNKSTDDDDDEYLEVDVVDGFYAPHSGVLFKTELMGDGGGRHE